MEMTYTREQFKKRIKVDGKWDRPKIERMAIWALERSNYNGHTDVDIVVDSRLERALYCNACGKWGSVSADPEEFGITGSAIFSQCKEATWK